MHKVPLLYFVVGSLLAVYRVRQLSIHHFREREPHYMRPWKKASFNQPKGVEAEISSPFYHIDKLSCRWRIFISMAIEFVQFDSHRLRPFE